MTEQLTTGVTSAKPAHFSAAVSSPLVKQMWCTVTSWIAHVASSANPTLTGTAIEINGTRGSETYHGWLIFLPTGTSLPTPVYDDTTREFTFYFDLANLAGAMHILEYPSRHPSNRSRGNYVMYREHQDGHVYADLHHDVL